MASHQPVTPSPQTIVNTREVVCIICACYTTLDVTTVIPACAAVDISLSNPGDSAQQRYGVGHMHLRQQEGVVNAMSLSQPGASVRGSSRQGLSSYPHAYTTSRRLATTTGRHTPEVIDTSKLHGAHWHDGGIACAVLIGAAPRRDDAGDTSSRPEAASVEQ